MTLFKCPSCNYLSENKSNIKRHTEIKHKNIQNIMSENIALNGKNVVKPGKNIAIHEENIVVEEENVAKYGENCVENSKLFQCDKCNKILSNKRNLEYHVNICKGISNALECYICHRIFNNYSAKSKHLKKCVHIKPVINEIVVIPDPYKKRPIPQSLRIAVWDTYIGLNIGQLACPICKTNTISQFNFHCGHIIAEKMGGATTIENLRPICKSCNCSMRTYNLEDFKNKYFKNE